jgi:hypothetical protein
MSIIEFDLLIMTFLSMDKPNKEWIVIPLTNNAPFAIYVIIRFFFLNLCFFIIVLDGFNDYFFSYYCNTTNILLFFLEFICANVSNA